MSEEKLQILNMVKEGKITSDEGVQLLNALDNDVGEMAPASKNAKKLRIKVLAPNHKNNTESKINLAIPIAIFRIGLQFVAKFAPDLEKVGLSQVDFEEILQAIDHGELGKIIDIDDDDGSRVEITIE